MTPDLHDSRIAVRTEFGPQQGLCGIAGKADLVTAEQEPGCKPAAGRAKGGIRPIFRFKGRLADGQSRYGWAKFRQILHQAVAITCRQRHERLAPREADLLMVCGIAGKAVLVAAECHSGCVIVYSGASRFMRDP
jgi:hypothetical protein